MRIALLSIAILTVGIAGLKLDASVRTHIFVPVKAATASTYQDSLGVVRPLIGGGAGRAIIGGQAQRGVTLSGKDAPLEARVNDLFGQLTQSEKLSLLSGTGFTTVSIPRLGIPAMGMADAGEGVRGGTAGTQGPATQFPTEVVMASSWDRDLLGRIGRTIGVEARNKGEGAQILLGPDINIHRSPLGGRDAESFTEDPYLNAQLAVAYIQGMQTTGTASCVKHFACNNEEQDRNTVDVHVDERALREIYLPGFKAAVQQGHAESVMASYNKVNGFYATANRILLTDILKSQWGFDGVLMSDWGAVHETVGAVNAGCDLEMPGGSFLTSDDLSAALQAATITQSSIDDSVKRILRTIIRTGLLDSPAPPNHLLVNSAEHQHLAYEAATKGIILLKNDRSVLPLDRTRLKSIAVIGPAAQGMQSGALGSPDVPPPYVINPLDAIDQTVGNNVRVSYVEGIALPSAGPDVIPTVNLSPPGASPTAHGLLGEYFTSDDLSGTAAATRVDPQIRFYRTSDTPDGMAAGTVNSVRWTGTLSAPQTGKYTFQIRTAAACRLLIDNNVVLDHAAGTSDSTGTTDLGVGSHDILVEMKDIGGKLRGRISWMVPGVSDIQAAANAAAKSDVAIVFVSTGRQEGEGHDRPSMALPGDQDALIEAVAAVNKRTIVVLNAGTPCVMKDWLAKTPAVLDAGFPGMEGGHAIASILFGDVDPSAKLTDTIGTAREDYPDFGNFPGTNGTVNYTEGIYVGYRHFDKKGIKPLFPFGYGLSYTTFKYGHLSIANPTLKSDGTAAVSIDVTNTGKREGAEVVELYIRDPQPKVDKPVRELKGFDKIDLKPGETGTAHFTVDPSALAYYEVAGKQWKADPGQYIVEIGASSRDIRQSAPITLVSTWTAPP